MEAASLIREARRRSGMTQAALAEAAGMTQPVISAYEAGRRQPTLPTLLHVLHAGGFDLDNDLVAAPLPVLALARRRREIVAEA
ncbi:MAG: helix-turn-helix domain-containing protein, partial [Actinomycetota bacterium]|nr:helix-turn-helix domain-containing protein [Actinomycetota bacterium]